MDRKRLDVHMVEAGLSPSREKARAMIMAGEVFVNGRKAEKAGEEVRPEDAVTLQEDPIPFVSRGGLKLDKALKVFPLTLRDKVCLDVGASTGGFTDCMLQNGARHVCALDVGYGQLAWQLRNDPRVTVMERHNARYMEPAWFEGPFDFASIDVSFISLKLILPPLDAAIHRDVCINIMGFAQELGYTVRDLSFSPITGPKGNIEFLLFLQIPVEAASAGIDDFEEKTAQIVADSHIFHINC